MTTPFIRPATSFESIKESLTTKKSYISKHPEFLLVGGIPFMFVVAGLLMAFKVPFETAGIISLSLTVIGIIVGGLASAFEDDKVDQQAKEKWQAYQKEYNAYLQTLPVDFLIKVANSPEVDHETEEQVTSYLNKHHKGWSLGPSLGNTLVSISKEEVLIPQKEDVRQPEMAQPLKRS